MNEKLNKEIMNSFIISDKKSNRIIFIMAIGILMLSFLPAIIITLKNFFLNYNNYQGGFINHLFYLPYIYVYDTN